ncbi:MAG: hypothetical protein ACSLE3_09525, partial [Microbacteriaceae bacterium]
ALTASTMVVVVVVTGFARLATSPLAYAASSNTRPVAGPPDIAARGREVAHVLVSRARPDICTRRMA